MRPALQLGLRKVHGRTQLNVVRAPVPSQACCGHRGRCNRYRRPCKKFSSNSADAYINVNVKEKICDVIRFRLRLRQPV